MMSWEHHHLGQFLFDEDYGWLQEMELPEFLRFSYAPIAQAATNTSVRFCFVADENDETPSTLATELASILQTNLELILDKIVGALFDDFSGSGPDSGMWWHGDLDHIQQIVSRLEAPLSKPNDLFRLLGAPSITIDEEVYGVEKPCVIFGFESPIDIEHGIGVLWDGTRILGIGYRTEPCVFEEM